MMMMMFALLMMRLDSGSGSHLALVLLLLILLDALALLLAGERRDEGAEQGEHEAHEPLDRMEILQSEGVQLR